jgi:hypothetical protein
MKIQDGSGNFYEMAGTDMILAICFWDVWEL